MKSAIVTALLVLVVPSAVEAQGVDFVLDRDFADRFAEEWIASWNSHELERVLSHYTDDFQMSSPRIAALGFSETGTLQGKEAMRAYWGPSLGEDSRVNMDHIATYLGANSITISYRSVASGRMAAEVLLFDDDGRVYESFAHYYQPD